MSGRLLPAGRYYLEDVAVGDRLETATLTLLAGHIDRFADLTGDRFDIHMNEEAAARHGFPARVAHGLLVLSLVDGLKNQAPAQFAAVASLGWDWQFRAPLFPGDTIRAVMEVRTTRPTSRPDRGIVTIGFTVLNQHEETVQHGVNTLMVLRRPAG
jgi:acyl dehydratase